jgi:hypothetical protein
MQAARVAAQLREAALEMARVAARRAQAGIAPVKELRAESDAPAPDAEYISPTFADLPATTQHAPDQHTNDQGLCAICGCAWPCERTEIGRALHISPEKGGSNAHDI